MHEDAKPNLIAGILPMRWSGAAFSSDCATITNRKSRNMLSGTEANGAWIVASTTAWLSPPGLPS